MKEIIIGIDHGYSNIKTANTCFKTGVITHEGKPAFTNDLLDYDGRYYTIGEGHKEYPMFMLSTTYCIFHRFIHKILRIA